MDVRHALPSPHPVVMTPGTCLRTPLSKLAEASFTPVGSGRVQAAVEGLEGVLERKRGEHLTCGVPLSGLPCPRRGTLDKPLCPAEALPLFAREFTAVPPRRAG